MKGAQIKMHDATVVQYSILKTGSRRVSQNQNIKNLGVFNLFCDLRASTSRKSLRSHRDSASSHWAVLYYPWTDIFISREFFVRTELSGTDVRRTRLRSMRSLRTGCAIFEYARLPLSPRVNIYSKSVLLTKMLSSWLPRFKKPALDRAEFSHAFILRSSENM